MKRFWIISMVMVFGIFNLTGQDKTTVEASSSDISDNLDLRAVASIFGDSKDLEEFEQKLNDPEYQISNIDLNNDGYVDYLRVVEKSENDTHLIAIQAVVGKDLYQDVATIEVEKDKNGETYVQVVGDVYMYGYGYIIEPVYYHHPIIFTFFWGPHYHLWHSPYYWGYYPNYYHPWHPWPTYVYIDHIHGHIHTQHVYHYTTIRRSPVCATWHKSIRQNHIEQSEPDRSFVRRNEGLQNRDALIQKRISKDSPDAVKPDYQKTDKPVSKEWKPKEDAAKKPGKTDNENKFPPASTKPDRKKDRNPTVKPEVKKPGVVKPKPSEKTKDKTPRKKDTRKNDKKIKKDKG